MLRQSLLAGGLLIAEVAAQFTPLTTTQRAHLDAALCQDASHVAFLVGTQSLGAVDSAGLHEVLLHTSANGTLTSFVWDRNNTQVWFVDGNTIASIGLAGGTPNVVAGNVTGSDLRVLCADPQMRALFGTRRDPATNSTAVWRLPLPGGGAPVDLLTRPGRIDELRIDATGSWLLFRTWTGTQPGPVAFERFDLAAANALTMATFAGVAESAHWVNAPNTFVVCTPSPTQTAPQIALVDLAGQVEFLTDDALPHRRVFAAAGSHELFHESASPTGGGTTIATVPNHGGGVMLSHAGQPLVLNGGASTGGLTFDGGETHLAFSAGTSANDPFPQVYLLELEEDLHIHPHLHLGQTFAIEHHVEAGEIGAVAVADGIAPAPLQVAPLDGDFWLDPTPGRLNVVLSGIGSGTGPIIGTWGIPNQPQLVGVRLFVQGVHFDAALAGGFTRLGYYQVF